MSRLRSRINALERRRRHPEPYTPLKLLITEDLGRALVLVERGGVLPDGGVQLGVSAPSTLSTAVAV